MTLTMTHENFFDLLSQYEQLGFMEAVKAYEPAQDLIREAEVKAWLKMLAIDYKKFKALVSSGEITAKRKGSAINSPRFYSKKEIKQALARHSVLSHIRNCMLN